MILADSTRIRVIRAYLGMNSTQFAARLGVRTATVTAWEKGRNTPTYMNRKEMSALCEEYGIAFSPPGVPFPVAESVIFQQGEAK